MSERRVAYFYNEEMGKFYYYKDHPMKPKRISMTHSLIESFDLYRLLDVYRNRKCTSEELLRFHHPDYVAYLQNYVCPDVLSRDGFMAQLDVVQPHERAFAMQNSRLKSQFSLNEAGDCPGFPGLYDFCQLSCGGSIDCSRLLLNGGADIAINWGGGLHHAKKCEASGFCYANDIVLAILEMLKVHARVLYVDIDVHHGDGVEEAFFLTDRVMTVSFHQYGDNFFPGTGALESVGEGKGKYYSLNIPLKSGMEDNTYNDLFKHVMDQVMAKFRPGGVVLQLGADSIAHDCLGRFNLTIKGHGECVRRMMSYGVPLVLLGGGGYAVQNVSRCWAYETGVALGLDIDGQIPRSDRFYEAYMPENKLHVSVKPKKNWNSPEDLHFLKERATEHLRMLDASPGVPFHNVPLIAFAEDEDFEGKSPANLVSTRMSD